MRPTALPVAPITLRKPSARRNQTPLTKDKIDRLVPLPPPNTTGPAGSSDRCNT